LFENGWRPRQAPAAPNAHRGLEADLADLGRVVLLARADPGFLHPGALEKIGVSPALRQVITAVNSALP
jgi:hypothetical protein